MRPNARDWEEGHEHARKRNEAILTPRTPQGHWRPFLTGVDGAKGVLVRTIRFTGFDGGYRTYAPGDVYIWDEGPRVSGGCTRIG